MLQAGLQYGPAILTGAREGSGLEEGGQLPAAFAAFVSCRSLASEPSVDSSCTVLLAFLVGCVAELHDGCCHAAHGYCQVKQFAGDLVDLRGC